MNKHDEMSVDEFRCLTRSEHEDQVKVVQWAAAMEFLHPCLRLLFAVPNGARTSMSQARKLKAEGLRKGVPDLFLPVARHGWHGLFIELKHGSNRPSPEQVKMMDDLTEQGYLAIVCWGYQEAITVLEEYITKD